MASPTTSDATQTFFTLPEDILAAFRGVGAVLQKVVTFDYFGGGLVVVGLLLILMGVIATMWSEDVQKPAQMFIAEGGAEKAAKLVKGG